MAVDGELNLVR